MRWRKKSWWLWGEGMSEEYEGQSERPEFRSGVLAEYGRDRILSFKPKSWRVFLDAISPERDDPSAIEIRAVWDRSLLTKDFRVGETNETLGDIPISIAIHRGNAEWLRDSMEKHGTTPREGKQTPRPMIGRLHYWEAANSSDGFVRDESGSVTGWIALGSKNYDVVKQMLIAEGEPSFVVGLTVKMQSADSTIWDGKEKLDVVEAKIVILHGPQEDEDSKSDDLENEDMPPLRKEYLELISRQDQLLAAVQRLMLPLWLIAGAVIAAVAFRWN